MVKIQLDAFEAYGRDGNQVKLRFNTTDAIWELFSEYDWIYELSLRTD